MSAKQANLIETTIEINHELYPCTIERKAIKNLVLRVKEGPRIVVHAPKRMSLTTIEQFITAHQTWLMKHLQRQERRADKGYRNKDGQRFWTVFDKDYPLTVIHGQKQKWVFLEDRIELTTPQTDEEQITKSVMKQGIRLLNEKATVYRQELDDWLIRQGLPIPTIHWRTMQSRWGSCIPIKAKITLNTRLLNYPPICLKAVVVHEFVHMKIANHGKDFYTCCEKLMPNYQEAMKILKTS